jgi:hypothetical protein
MSANERLPITLSFEIKNNKKYTRVDNVYRIRKLHRYLEEKFNVKNFCVEYPKKYVSYFLGNQTEKIMWWLLYNQNVELKNILIWWQ